MPRGQGKRMDAWKGLGLRGRLALAATVAGALLTLASPAWAARVVNGDFETGTLTGFTVVNRAADRGSWFAYSATNPPPEFCSTVVPPEAPPQGTFAATTDLDDDGSYVLYQDVALEPNARHTLSFILYYRSIEPFATPATLDWTQGPNQQYRVDILKPSADPFSVAPADVLARGLPHRGGGPADPRSDTDDLRPQPLWRTDCASALRRSRWSRLLSSLGRRHRRADTAFGSSPGLHDQRDERQRRHPRHLRP